LPFFAHFAFLHLLFSRNVLGVAAAAVVRRKNTDNNQCTIYVAVVVVVIILSRREEKKTKNKNYCPYFIYLIRNSIDRVEDIK